MNKEDLASNSLKWLICNKNKPNQTITSLYGEGLLPF